MVAFNNLYGVYSVDANTGWTVGAGGTVIKTMDAGQTWEAKIIGPDELRSIYAPRCSNRLDRWIQWRNLCHYRWGCGVESTDYTNRRNSARNMLHQC